VGRRTFPARLPAAILLASLLAPASPAAAADTKAFAFATDFSTGWLSVADLATRAVAVDVERVHSDAALRYHGGFLYVVNRFGGDNVQVIDPATYETVRQFSTGNGSNPQDIAFVSPTKAYVSRYGSADLLVVNPSDPQGLPMSTISLAAFADSDGLPEMARMIRIGRHLFVACQRLTNFVPSNPSVVAVVDTENDQVVDVDPAAPGVQGIVLAARNPVTTFEYDRARGRLLVGCAGSFGALDGGIERIDPYGLASEGVLASETTLGGDLLDIVWHTATHAYALVSDGSVNRLVAWNPETGAKIADRFTANGGFSLPDMEINDRGELYVCKNPSPATISDPPGLLVFDVATDALLAGPLGTGLPPVAITFDRATDEVTAVPGSPPAALRLRGPWPNPARAAARVALRLGRAEQVEVAVLDPAGRRVRELAAGRMEAGERAWAWDLADAHGRRVPAGVYLVQVRMGTARATRKLAVLP
jgi:hypothetical protein